MCSPKEEEKKHMILNYNKTPTAKLYNEQSPNDTEYIDEFGFAKHILNPHHITSHVFSEKWCVFLCQNKIITNVHFIAFRLTNIANITFSIFFLQTNSIEMYI